MHTRSSHLLTAALMSVIHLTPDAVLPGDCALLRLGDWGIGKIDGHLMFYVGKRRYLDTPIPAPSEGSRWVVAYRTFPFIVLGGAGVAVGLYRRREKDQPRVRKPEVGG